MMYLFDDGEFQSGGLATCRRHCANLFGIAARSCRRRGLRSIVTFGQFMK